MSPTGDQHPGHGLAPDDRSCVEPAGAAAGNVADVQTTLSRADVPAYRSMVYAIAQRDQMETAAAGSEACFRSLVHQLPEVVAICEANGTVRYHNPVVESLLGYGPMDVADSDITTFLHPDDRPVLRALHSRLRRRPGSHLTTVLRVRHRNGEWCSLEVVVTNLLDNPSVRGFVVIARDRTEHMRLEAALALRAVHDPLTGLPNRTLFRDRLDHALARTRRREATVALIFLDLDHFKSINDTGGQASGDALLVAVAERLQSMLRPADTFARLGGDEFAILLEDVAPRAARRIADALHRALREPFSIDGESVAITASAGITLGDADRRNADVLLRAAGEALYRAKAAGRDQVIEVRPNALSLEGSVAGRFM